MANENNFKMTFSSGIALLDMSLRHPLFHRTIKALFIDMQESGYEHPTLENMGIFRDELIEELLRFPNAAHDDLARDVVHYRPDLQIAQREARRAHE